MNKKAIIILGAIFVLIVGTLGFLIYSKYGNKGTVTPPVSQGDTNPPAGGTNNPPTTTPPTNDTPPPSTGPKFVKLLDTQVVSPVLCYNGQGVTYFDASGQLYQGAFGGGNCQDVSGNQVTLISPLQIGNTQSLSIQTRSDISRVLWPQAGDNFIVETKNGTKKSWSFYNNDTRVYVDLPPQVTAVDWHPSGTMIYYIWQENGKATLNIGDGDTGNWQYVGDMWEMNDIISVSPDGKNLLYYEDNISGNANPINSVTADGKAWKTLVSDGMNYGVLWSPDSQQFLFGKKGASGTNFEVWYYNLLTGEAKSLAVAAAMDKIAWAADSSAIYVAVPKDGADGYEKMTTDVFAKIDIATGNTQQYDPGTTVIDGRNLFLSKDETKLFFKNAQDGSLYYLDLGL